jgi:hypothetical protein
MRAASRRCTALVLYVVALVPLPAAAQVDVLTHRYDNGRSGANQNETQLKKSNVNNAKFGKLAFRIVDGNIYAQPLIVSRARIANRPNPVNIVIVATEHNSVYAFDADDTSAENGGQQTQKALWFRGPKNGQDGSPGLGDSIDTNILYPKIGNAHCEDLTTEVGITSTPAIKLTSDGSGNTGKEGFVFVVAKSIGGGQITYKLFSLPLADGKPASDGVVIAGSVNGPGGPIEFDPVFHLNRPALLLDGNVLYMAFGGHCDTGSYRGWIFAYDVSNAAAPQKIDAFSTTFAPRTNNSKEGRAGIWMSGHGLTSDSDGVYFATGDGTYNVANASARDLGNTVVRTKLVSGKIQVQDWFVPQDPKNREDLKKFDADLGSGGVVLVPNSHLLLAGGKEGRLYLLDRNDLGHGAKVSVQSFIATNPPLERFPNPQQAGDVLFWNIHGAAVVWPRQNDTFVYLMGEENPLKQWKLIRDAGPAGWKFQSDAPFKKSKVSAPLPNNPIDPKRNHIWMPGGFLTLSANGTESGSGIVWATMPFREDANHQVVTGILRAFDAADVSKNQLWSSEESGNPNDSLGLFAKNNPPVVANGKVFVAAFQQETVDNNTGQHFKAAGGLQSALAIYGLK